jgi:hypothetical protein
MKSGGVLASPTKTKALPGSDKLVPNTTIPENRDCASAQPGAVRSKHVQHIAAQRMQDERTRSTLIMV